MAKPSETGGVANKTAIAVSFDSKHIDSITKGGFSAVVRRRVPRGKPHYLYFHVNSPVSALVGRAQIKSLRLVTRDEAVALADELNMSRNDIEDYVGDRSVVGIYEIAAIELFKKPVKTQDLQELSSYHPPQNFMQLTEGTLGAIMRLSGGGVS